MAKFPFKRGLSSLMAVMMLLSVTGCGDNKEKDSSTPEKDIYVSVDQDGKKAVVDKAGKVITDFVLDKDGNITDKDGEIVIPADKVQELPKTPAKPSKKPVYVEKDKNGKEQVVDQSGKPVEGYTVDEDGNISDEDGNTVVESSEVTTPPAKPDKKPSKPDKNNSHKGDAHKEDSSSGTSSSSSGSSGSSSSSSSHSEKPAPAKPSKPAPSKSDPKPEKPAKPVHKHSWKPVYRTEVVDDYDFREVTWCDDCGQDMTGWSADEIEAHVDYELDRGNSGRYKSSSKKVVVGSHKKKVIDHYECSCGATK